MTTYVEKDFKCAVCDDVSAHKLMRSTTTFGSPDLDTRPPGLVRFAISHAIPICPHCGYSAPDISEPNEYLKEIVKIETYKELPINPKYSKLANAFLCYSFIQEKLNHYAEAG